MKWLLLVVVLLACGGSRQAPPQDPVISNSTPTPPPDAAIDAATSPVDRLAAFADAMCRCGDKACAEQVTEELATWAKELNEGPQSAQKFSEEDTRRAQEITERFGKCMTAIMTKAQGTP